MGKTISVDELTYSTVVTLAGKMMMTIGKPVSLGLAIYVATLVFDMILAKLSKEDTKKFKEVMKEVATEEFDEMMEETFKTIVGRQR